jgi:GT2 family glycosyltransferase
MSRTIPAVAVIPTWNGWQDTHRCLESLAAADPACERIKVVDNGSSDGTPERIRADWPDVELLTLPENLGFSPAVNRALDPLTRESGIEAVFLLNNDVVLDPDAGGGLWESISNERIAGACPLITYVDPPDRVWYGGGEVALWRGYVGHRHSRAGVESVGKGVGPTGYLTGAAAMLRVDALRDVGLLDERFSFYAEDVDWSLRARARGWQLLLDSRVRVAHRVSASIGGPFSRSKLSAKGRALARLFARHARPWEWLTVLPGGLLLTLPQTVSGMRRGGARGQ